MVAAFNLPGMSSPLMIAIGNKAKVKSQIMFSAEYRYVKMTRSSIGRHVPLGSDLSQKNVMGRHCSKVRNRKTAPITQLRSITA